VILLSYGFLFYFFKLHQSASNISVFIHLYKQCSSVIL